MSISNSRATTGAAILITLGLVAGCDRNDRATVPAAEQTAPTPQPVSDDELGTDTGITTQINAKYFRDPEVNGRVIDVTTNSGVGNPHPATAAKAEQMMTVVVERLSQFLVELSAVIVMLCVDPLEVLQGQVLDPRSVVQRLGDDVAGSHVALELEHMHARVRVDREQVDEATVLSANLPTENKKIRTDHRRFSQQHVLEAALQLELRGAELDGAFIGHSPDRHLHRHVAPF